MTLREVDHVCYTPASPQWGDLWDQLLELTGDPDTTMCYAATGEVWQYMGTHRAGGPVLRHEFRHRAHPRFGGARCYLFVPVLDGDSWRERAILSVVTYATPQDAPRRHYEFTGAAIRTARIPPPEPLPRLFREEDCGGAFDGCHVSSDVDPGL